MDLSRLVKRALEYRGFTVISDSPVLLVSNGKEEYAVMPVSNSEERYVVSQMTGVKKMVIGLEEGMEPMGDIFWSREDFEVIVGKMLLDEATGMHEERIMPSFEEAFVEHREPVARTIPRSEIQTGEGEPLAETITLMPFHVVQFSMDDGEEGIMLVDAIDGESYHVQKPLRVESGMGDRQIREPEIASEDAVSMATEHIISMHTVEEENVVEAGSVTVVEKKTRSPSRESISTDYLGILYVPVLFVEGEEGTVAIDASGLMSFRKHY